MVLKGLISRQSTKHSERELRVSLNFLTTGTLTRALQGSVRKCLVHSHSPRVSSSKGLASLMRRLSLSLGLSLLPARSPDNLPHGCTSSNLSSPRTLSIADPAHLLPFCRP
ncbi:hypothetical protein E2C01_031579 [Portunus trituberculatus]|uniref:Uncharacterized protein n=1 Tax=Portunus trituberculatus TaxID=210409 RepID=A0A5B7EYH8_PORTR|nr:hypothetical protein [Portunus trituberculatus]